MQFSYVLMAVATIPVVIEACSPSAANKQLVPNSSSKYSASNDVEFRSWRSNLGKSYSNAAEENRRYGNYKRSLEAVRAHNEKAELYGFRLGLNVFSDMDPSEKAKRLGLLGPNGERLAYEPMTLPEQLDRTERSAEEQANLDMEVEDGILESPEPDLKVGAATTKRTTTKRTTTRRSTTTKTTRAPTTKMTTKLTTKAATTTMPTTTSSSPALGLDWRSTGMVTPVKDQGQCGSCWAFAATGALESRLKIKYGGANTILSEQQLVDCSTSYGNGGCNGGWMNSAFRYLYDFGGSNLNLSYPYTAKDGSCKAIATEKYAPLNPSPGYVNVAKNEAAMIQALASGPLVIAFEVLDDFYSYESGVYRSSSCSGSINHAMLLVGYGVEADGTKYWIVKNSWSKWWGDDGYIKIIRGVNNCGIESYASYPNLA